VRPEELAKMEAKVKTRSQKGKVPPKLPPGFEFTLEQRKGRPLPDSKTPGKVPRDKCKHPVERIAIRGNGESKWITCLDCASRWERLSDEEVLNRNSLMTAPHGVMCYMPPGPLKPVAESVEASSSSDTSDQSWLKIAENPTTILDREFPPGHPFRIQHAMLVPSMQSAEQMMSHLISVNPGQEEAVMRYLTLKGLSASESGL